MLPAGVSARLANPRARKVVLVTLNLHGLDPNDKYRPLALEPGSVVLSTHPGVHVTHGASGVTVPAWPLLVEWPVIQRRYWPQERRAGIAEGSIAVVPQTAILRRLLSFGEGSLATARVDYWTDGVDLDDVVPRLAGRVTGIAAPRREGVATLRLTDGDPDTGSDLPVGVLTRADWANLPETVAGIQQRQTIIGDFPADVLCAQLDADGTRWYVCDPPATVGPSAVSLNGQRLYGRWQSRTATTSTGIAYTELVFDTPAIQQAAAPLVVMCHGGVGLTHDGAIPMLLAMGGLSLSPKARAIAETLRRAFDLSVLLNATGNTWEIVRDRLGAQTPYVFTLHRNMVDVIDTQGAVPLHYLGVGSGLLGRTETTATEVTTTAIVNALEVTCGRSSAQTDQPLWRVYRDATHGPPDTQARCALSEHRYGRKYLTVPAPDLALVYDRAGRIVACPSAERFADAFIALHSIVWRPYSYLADWVRGLAVELGDAVKLTDPAESFVDRAAVVGGIVDGPTGPMLDLFVGGTG